MILQCSCSLLSLLRCVEARGANGVRAGCGGAELHSGSPREQEQYLQKFRVSGSSTAFRSPPCCMRTLLLLFLRSAFAVGRVGVSGSSSVQETVGFRVYLLQRLLSFILRVSVFYFSPQSPQFFLVTGNVTMEDAKSVQASGPSQTTGLQNSLDSATSNLVGKEAGKECVPLESSRLLPPTAVVAAAPSIVGQPLCEVGAERHKHGGVAAVEGATLAAADEQDPLGGRKALVAESAVLDEPVVQVLSDARAGGQCAATDSSDQQREEKPEPVESLDRPDELKERIEAGNSHGTDSLKHGELNGVDSINGEPIKSKPQVDRDTLTSPSESTLMGVLGKLVSLDPTEVFKDPVNDSFAPNYSKVIKTPMCFSMMQEKIGLQQYPSWSLFVEDFERICYNAMKYNQKRSRVWNGASTLLRQGKKVIEPYTEKVDSMLGLSGAVENAPASAASAAQDAAKTAAPYATNSEGQDIVEDAVQDPAKAVILDVEENVFQMATGTADELGEDKAVASHQGGVLEKEFVPKSDIADVASAAISPTHLDMRSSQDGEKGDPAIPGDMRQDAMKEMVTVAHDVRDSIAIQNDELPHNSETRNAGSPLETRANHVDEDMKVEILESTDSEDVRPDSRDEATENSSSFADTQSKVESDPEGDRFQQNAEVESELRDGNGALSSACAEDDEVAGGNERGKKALNAEWKKYRRGIEWRCRWLEIRLNELRERSQRYDRLLEERRAKKAKAWVANVQPGEESSARSAQMVDSPERGRILRRMRRKQVENTVDLELYMARHPLFSRYGTYGESKYKKRKRETEDPHVEAKIDAFQHIQNQQNSVEPEKRAPDESDTEEQLVLGRSSLGSQDSMEKILWKVEALQARVEKAKAQLLRGAPPKSVPQPLTIPKPPSNFSRVASQASPSPRMIAPSPLPRPPGTKGRPPSGQSPGFSGTPTANGAPQRQASVQLRRKSSDYDINNMVMPVSVGAKYVEHIKHADIWTPHWRLIDDTEAPDQSTGGSSSDEDTDDEKFATRHSEMEVNEKKHRYMLPPKRSPDGDVALAGKGRSKSGMGKGAGKMSGRDSVPTKAIAVPAVESPPDSGSAPAYAGSVPKGKRRKRLFNATAFTSNRAQRLTAHLAEPSGSLQSPEGVRESVLEDTVEARTSEETHTEHTIAPPEVEKSSVQPVQSVDQSDAKRKRSVASGLQVLANP